MVFPWVAAGATLLSGLSNIFGAQESARAQENATEHGIHALQQYLTPYADFGLNSMYQMQGLTGSPGLTPYTSQSNVLGLLQPGTWQNLGTYGTAASQLATQPATWQGTSTPGTGAPVGYNNIGLVGMPTAGGSPGGPVYGGSDSSNISNAFGGLLAAGLTPQQAGSIAGMASSGATPIGPAYTGGPNSTTLGNLPGYQWLASEALKAGHNSYAAKGLGTSFPEVGAAMATRAANVTMPFYNDFWKQLMAQTEFGANVAGQLGTGIANLNVGRGNAQAAGSAGTWSNISAIPDMMSGNMALAKGLGLGGGGGAPNVAALPTMAYAPNPYSNAYA